MGRLLEALVLFGVLLAGAGFAAMRWNVAVRGRRLKRAPWELAEHSDGELLTVFAERPGEERILIGAEACANRDFEYRIEEVRSRGRQKIAALNSGARR